MRTLLLLGLIITLSACGQAPEVEPTVDPPFHAWTDSLVSAYFARRPAPGPPDTLSLEAARAVQSRFVERLADSLGSVIGYKAGLTSEATRRRFQADAPVHGLLLEDMILASGSAISSRYGARPIFEGDLIVRVGSSSINEADDDEALARSLDAVIPFIELPDLFFGEEVTLSGPLLTAANVAARLGITGASVALDSLDRLAHLRRIRIELIENDSTIATASSDVLMGDPIRAVRWLRDTLVADGVRLTAGDLLSLGSMTPPFPVRAGSRVRAVYHGLQEDPVEISVSFLSSEAAEE